MSLVGVKISLTILKNSLTSSKVEDMYIVFVECQSEKNSKV